MLSKRDCQLSSSKRPSRSRLTLTRAKTHHDQSLSGHVRVNANWRAGRKCPQDLAFENFSAVLAFAQEEGFRLYGTYDFSHLHGLARSIDKLSMSEAAFHGASP